MGFPMPKLTYIKLLGSCNGLFYGWNFYTEYFYFLWNPATKVSRRLEKPDKSLSCGDSHGFGYDYKTDDYKLVKIREWSGFVHVYSLKSNSWKGFTLKSNPWKGIRPDKNTFGSCDFSGVLFNGHFHWLVARGKASSNMIVSMDISDECFKDLQLPMTVQTTCVHFLNVGVLEECLCILVRIEEIFEVWVMQDYGVSESWTRLYTITFEGAILDPCTSDVKLMGSFKNGDILFKNDEAANWMDRDSLILYDSKCGTARKLNICGFQIGRAVSYYESLVSLGI